MDRGKGEDKKYIRECCFSAECSHVYSVNAVPQARATALAAAGRDYIVIFHAFRSGATRAWDASTPE
jgi:hypothetical protein